MNPVDEYYHMIYGDVQLAKMIYRVPEDRIVVRLSSGLATVFALANRFLNINIHDAGLMIFGCKAETYHAPDELSYRVMVETTYRVIPQKEDANNGL
jgi:hypothetical protein